jgi:hypothetical protein
MDQERLALKADDGSDLPPPPSEAWREHTAERWLRDDPSGYQECIECIRRGELNKSKLATRFNRSRNTVLALIVKEFSVEQLRDINGKIAAIVTGEALAAQDELIEEATVKELGAVSIAGKAAFDIAQVASGGPTEIRENRNLTVTVDDFKKWLEEEPAIDSQAGKVSAMPPTLDADSGAVVDVCLSGINPPTKDAQTVDIENINAFSILLFIQISLELLSGFYRGGGG